jgi:hypothetical protein
MRGAVPEAVGDYIATLSDPFCFGPTRLGWGTMIPTGLGTAFYRASLQTPSDGTFGCAVFPFLRNTTGVYGVQVCNAGLSTATWTPAAWSNQSAYANLASQARVVSIGIKAYPQVPLTSAPGIIYSGAIPELTQNQLITNTINFFTGSPYFEVGYGNVGAMASGRPVDPNSFIFQFTTADNATTGTPPQISVPMIFGTGFPASTNIVIEAVYNFEYELSPQWNDQVLPGPFEGGSEQEGGITSNFANIESMWNYIRMRLPPVSITDSISNLARNSGLAALRSIGRTMIAPRSTGSSGTGRMHTALLNGASAAAGNVAASLGSSAAGMLRRNIFGSASGARHSAGLLEDFTVV